MCDATTNYGRTIQLFLVDGAPTGLIIATIHGWTGSILVASQSNFGRLLARRELNRTGIYILYGPDPDGILNARAYIGEADSVRDRIDKSAKEHLFWEAAIVITTSDETLTKGHVRYLEARLIEMTRAAGRVALDNVQEALVERRHLPEADRANMEAFLANLRVILPVIGRDLLKERPKIEAQIPVSIGAKAPGTQQFELRHKSGIHTLAVDQDGEFVVRSGSEALEGENSQHNYVNLRRDLIGKRILAPVEGRHIYKFSQDYTFKRPSAAATVILNRSSNGRIEWKLVGTELNYHESQEREAQREQATE